MTNPAIVWPYAVTGDLKFYVGATLDTVTLTLDGTEDMATRLSKLKTAMETHSAGPTITVTLLSTQKVRIFVGGLTAQLLWTDAATTLDAEIFGWSNSSDYGPFATLNAPNQVGGLWVPGKEPEEDTGDVQRVVGGTSTALSGKQRTSYFAQPYAERDLVFGLLQPAVTEDRFADSAAPQGTLERAWLDALSKGRSLFYAEDESDLATYTEYKLRDAGRRPISRDDRFPAQRWKGELMLRKVA